jgi:sugar (pentulose or hexulose) kinase
VPLRFPAEAEAAALGAALQAAAVGSAEPSVRRFVQAHPPPLLQLLVTPDPATAPAYLAAYERHVRLGAGLFAPRP